MIEFKKKHLKMDEFIRPKLDYIDKFLGDFKVNQLGYGYGFRSVKIGIEIGGTIHDVDWFTNYIKREFDAIFSEEDPFTVQIKVSTQDVDLTWMNKVGWFSGSGSYITKKV